MIQADGIVFLTWIRARQRAGRSEGQRNWPGDQILSPRPNITPALPKAAKTASVPDHTRPPRRRRDVSFSRGLARPEAHIFPARQDNFSKSRTHWPVLIFQ
jgi:hypothetical protein